MEKNNAVVNQFFITSNCQLKNKRRLRTSAATLIGVNTALKILNKNILINVMEK